MRVLHGSPRYVSYSSRPLWCVIAAVAALIASAGTASGQATDRRRPQPEEPPSLDLAIHNVGLSIGNSRRHTGLRCHWRDEGVVRINGINTTLWLPGDSPTGQINGLSLGLIAPGAASLNGITAGLGGIVAGRSLTGIAAGGVAVLSHGRIAGVTAGGLVVTG